MLTSIEWDICNGLVSNSRIKYLEDTIGIKFPKTFTEVIKNCDRGYPKKDEFRYFDSFLNRSFLCGVGSFLGLEDSQYDDFLKNYLNPPEFFPKDIIGFAITGNGDFICFDYRKGKDNPDPPIVYWNHEADIGKDVSFIANNFDDFLGMLKEPEEERTI